MRRNLRLFLRTLSPGGPDAPASCRAATSPCDRVTGYAEVLPTIWEYLLANDPRSKLITTRTLLSHTAGFNNARYFDPEHRLVIHFQPGTRYSYGSEGYSLLQLVVETVTQTPTEELMQERVFQPLGMTRTSMVWQQAFESDHANGYG